MILLGVFNIKSGTFHALMVPNIPWAWGRIGGFTSRKTKIGSSTTPTRVQPHFPATTKCIVTMPNALLPNFALCLLLETIEIVIIITI